MTLSSVLRNPHTVCAKVKILVTLEYEHFLFFSIRVVIRWVIMFEIASHIYTVCWQLELMADVCPYACTHSLFHFLHTTTFSSPQNVSLGDVHFTENSCDVTECDGRITWEFHHSHRQTENRTICDSFPLHIANISHF